MRKDWSIVELVTRKEVVKAIANLEESALGPDGITLNEMTLISPVLLTAF